jgi:hypothetical protein
MRNRDPRYSPRDVYWSAMKGTALGAMKRADWQTVQSAYFQMALQAWDESGEDLAPERAITLQREADRAQLRDLLKEGSLNRQGVRDTRVAIVGCDCVSCRAGPHSRLWARDELSAPHIPHSSCGRYGWCPCEYVVDL